MRYLAVEGQRSRILNGASPEMPQRRQIERRELSICSDKKRQHGHFQKITIQLA
jgi:hypothetical protein